MRGGHPLNAIAAVPGPRRAGALFALAVLAAPFLLVPGDWAGWWLVLVCVGTLLVAPAVNRSPALLAAALTVLLFHQGASLVAAYGFPGELPLPDANYFHAYASNIAQYDPLRLRLGAGFYENLLSAVYKLFGDSLLLGQQVSVLCFTLSTVIFVRLLDRLQVRRWQPLWVLLFGLPLSVIVFTSLTMRESLQLVLFMASVDLALLARDGRTAAALPALVCALVLGLSHAVLMAYAGGMLLLFVFWPVPGKHRRIAWVGAAVVVVLVAAAVVPRLDVRRDDNPFVLLDKGVVGAIDRYRRDVNKGAPESLYRVQLDTSSTGAALVSLPAFYAHYLFAPFPWQVRGLKDFYACLEGVMRLALAVLALAGMWRAGRSGRYPASILLALFVAMSLMWTLGTTNYGQALRHHVLTHWLLVALAAWGAQTWGWRPATAATGG